MDQLFAAIMLTIGGGVLLFYAFIIADFLTILNTQMSAAFIETKKLNPANFGFYLEEQ
jgi:hypothetical protein